MEDFIGEAPEGDASEEFDLEDGETASEASVASLPPIDEAELDGEILIEEPPEPEKPRKKKKTIDPAALAAHRVWKRNRAERKAAKKAKRKAEAKAKKRRGHGADLEAFLVKTKERLESRAAEAEAEAAAAIVASARPLRPAGSDLRSFILKTRERLADQVAAERAAQRAKEAKAAALAASVDLETFRRECQARIAQKLLSNIPQVKAGETPDEDLCRFQRRKIAIVGAGPVGLWAAMLLAQKYRWTDPSGVLRLRPDAPQIVLMEARPMASHCARTDIRIALSSSTRSMLDQQTRSRAFSSGMPVVEIEENFLRRWKKVAGAEAQIEYEKSIQDPADLLGYDGILWSAGRRSLNEALRKDLGCEVRIGDSQKVIVFQIQELGGDAWHLSSLDLSGAAQQAGRVPQLRVMLRPGFEGACACWLWVFGLPLDVLESLVPKQASSLPRETLVEAFEDLIGNDGFGALRASLEALQQRLKAAGITARVVDASFWSSDRAVCQVPSSLVPLVLIGDALAGKPFYTGSTLNRHLWDVAKLVEEVEFAYDGGPLDVSRFGSYERRYQECVRRIGEFQRRGPGAALLKPLPRMTSLTALKRQVHVDSDASDASSPTPMKSLILPALARAAAH